MTDGVPHLSVHDLRAELGKSSRRKRGLVALHGTGDEQDLAVEAGVVRVIPVRSELELRARMPPITGGDDDARIAFLVPWTHDVPLDLAGRFARNGRVKRIGKDARLRHLFGVGEVDPEAAGSPLVDYLLRPAGQRRYPVGDGRLTADAMWAAWLSRDVRVPTDGGLALDTLLGWAATDRRGARFAEAMADPAAAGVADALAAHLRARLGPAGPVVWRAWQDGRGATALELAVLFEVLADSPQAGVRMWIRTRVRETLGVDDDGELMAVAAALGREAPGALRYVEREAGLSESRTLVQAADDRVADPEVREAAAASTRLPSAWAHRLDALGEALRRGTDAVAGERADAADAAETAIRALRALEGHVLFKDADQAHVLKRAEMAVRLLCWLAVRPDRRIVASPTPYGDVEALGRWYAEEGGYVDWARRWARGTVETALGVGIGAVVRAADDARSALDRRFARGLAGWIEAGQPSHQVVPIHDAVRRIASKFLDENPERRMLVLLLDGMAWAQAVELLASLGSRAAPWGPLAWHRTAAGRIGEGAYPVVLAALPTVTEVSRSSLFAGKPMKPGARLDTARDPELWASNPHVRKHIDGADAPRLLLRSAGHDKGGSASREALSLVADGDRRVVAMVLNAIDDSLKASHAVRHPWGVDNIASLPDLLDCAREHGRAVWLASDHGHVPADRLERASGAHPAAGDRRAGGGARWRPWHTADAPVADDEVAIAATGGRVYAPRGAHGIVMPSGDTRCYAGSTHAGEHGGATLAEVVVPCLLVGCESNAGEDAGAAVGAALVPGWWHFDVRGYGVGAEPAPAAAASVPEAQLGLPLAAGGADDRAVAARPRKAAPVTPSAFAKSQVLIRTTTAQARKDVVAAVDVLLARGGVMSADAFAAAVEVLPFRVGGYISRLQEVLNLDGYEVVRYDPASRQVHLDRGKLALLFEVTL